MTVVGFISGSSVVHTPSSSSSVRSSRIHSFGMWNASRRSARLTFSARRSSRLPRLSSGSNVRSLSVQPSTDTCERIFSWKYSTTRSNTSGSARREMKPISFIAVTMRVVSRVIAPCRNEIIPRRIASDTVAVAPKSRKTMVGASPSVAAAAAAGSRGADRRGTGRRRRSAGSRPRRRSAPPFADRCSRPRGAARSATLAPSIHSVVSTRDVESRGSRAGSVRAGAPA